MNLVERLNARFNNVIHDGLAAFGAVVDPWLARLERQAMSNALGRDFGLDYADSLVAVEAEEEVHEPARFLYLCDRCFAQMDQGYHDSNGGVCMDCSMKDSAIRAIWCFEHQQLRSGCHGLPHVSAGHRLSADPSPTPVGDIGPGAGMVPPPPAPGPSNGWDELHKQVGPNSPKWIHDAIDSTKQCCRSFAREFLDDDEFMELEEFLDTATAEELAAMRQQREVSRADLTAHIRAIFLDGEEGEIGPLVLDLVDGIATQVTDSLVSAFRITPR